MNTTNTAYKKEVWDDYAHAFLSIMPSMMLQLNKEVASLATGDICDFGCGAAKIAPFVLDRKEVTSYTGIDYSPNMVERARWHLEQFPDKPSEIIRGKIEFIDTGAYDVEIVSGKTEAFSTLMYDFGLSINSYYTWDTPSTVLNSIYNTLSPEAHFVLVTPNPTMDMAQILEEVKKEQVANPYFEHFMEQNMALANNEKALFIEMNELILQVQQAGFKVVEAKQHLYNKGLNFLHLKK